jgi:regulator of sigma E protease
MMTSLATFASALGDRFLFAAAFLFVLSVVVFVHEMGHFLVARWCGVAVSAFSIGFGREIWGFDDKHGTRWRIAWIPLGGYVKFMDDDNPSSVPTADAARQMTPEQLASSFHAKPVWQRAAVVAAGPIANFLLAIAIFTGMLLWVGIVTVEPRVGEVIEGSPASAAGLKAGDLIVSIDGREIEDFGELQHVIMINPGRPLGFIIERGGARMPVTVVPELREQQDSIAGRHRRALIGIKSMGTASKVVRKQVGPIEAVSRAIGRTGDIVVGTATYIKDVVVRIQDPDQLGGVIRIADVSGQVAKLGPEALINLVAVLSVSVGLLNLLPIPVLDGGHLLFFAIEALRRRPLSARAQEVGLKLGLAVVLALFIFTTINDLPILKKWLS